MDAKCNILSKQLLITQQLPTTVIGRFDTG